MSRAAVAVGGYDAASNPFRASRILEFRYRFLDSGWDALEARLAAAGMRGAIVGPEGSGKTTLLEDLCERLARRGHRAVLMDGADALSWTAWRRFLRESRAASGVVVTAHREGFLPTLVRTRTTPELLALAVRELSGRSCEDFGVSPEALFARHRGNVRTALRELYDRCAGRR